MLHVFQAWYTFELVSAWKIWGEVLCCGSCAQYSAGTQDSTTVTEPCRWLVEQGLTVHVRVQHHDAMQA